MDNDEHLKVFLQSVGQEDRDKWSKKTGEILIENYILLTHYQVLMTNYYYRRSRVTLIGRAHGFSQ